MLSGVLTVLVLLGMAIAVVALVLWGLAKRARRRLEQELRSRMGGPDPLRDPTGTADATRIKPGDVVQYDGADWVVRGSLTYDEDGAGWQEHLIDASGTAGERRAWLSVEEAESGLELVLWTRREGLTLQPTDVVELDGTSFRRDESGSARFQATGTTGTAPSGTMQYVDYRSTGPTRLSFERWSREGSWEISTGEPVAAESMQVLHR